MEHRVIYNDVEVLSIDDNQGIAYTSDKIIIADLKVCKTALDKLGVDTSKINDFEYQDATNYKYFLIPTELVANIKHYAGFVKDAYPELMFDVVLSSESIPVEEKTIRVVTNSLSVIPCAVTRWTDEGLMVLDAVVENWNYNVPSKRITFDVKFESYSELIAFRNSNTL